MTLANRSPFTFPPSYNRDRHWPEPPDEDHCSYCGQPDHHPCPVWQEHERWEQARQARSQRDAA